MMNNKSMLLSALVRLVRQRGTKHHHVEQIIPWLSHNTLSLRRHALRVPCESRWLSAAVTRHREVLSAFIGTSSTSLARFYHYMCELHGEQILVHESKGCLADPSDECESATSAELNLLARGCSKHIKRKQQGTTKRT